MRLETDAPRILMFLAAAAWAGATGASLAQAPPTAAAASKPLRLPPDVTPEQLADAEKAAEAARWLEQEHPEPRAEGARMLLAILRGTWMSGTDSWFGPAATRYDWAWLASRCGAGAEAKSVAKSEFPGTAAHFDALDRDGDGQITADDLDWSEASSYVADASVLNRLFRRWDASGDGKLSSGEFQSFFDLVAKGRDHFTAADLRDAVIPRGPLGFTPGNEPTVPLLIRGLFSGEIGSISEGPRLNDPAPDFTLRTPDGAETVQLAKLLGTKPLVLVFGNFTCGPFRGLYPDVEAVHRRYKDQASFLMVYVREAHPSDGWKMESNTRVGVVAQQPSSDGERAEVCVRFCRMLAPEIPVAVDAIDDPAGTAYSAMPARLYVLDPSGRVAYKSGRGPFGFKPGEMEQALVMCLLESAAAPGPRTGAPGSTPPIEGPDAPAAQPQEERGALR